MLEQIIQPGFYDTDALGHINNTALPRWFELARLPIFKIFTPDLDPQKWKLIVVKLDIAFQSQLDYRESVTIQSAIEHIGNSSFVVQQHCVQSETVGAIGHTTMVRFNYETQKSQPLSPVERAALEALKTSS